MLNICLSTHICLWDIKELQSILFVLQYPSADLLSSRCNTWNTLVCLVAYVVSVLKIILSLQRQFRHNSVGPLFTDSVSLCTSVYRVSNTVHSRRGTRGWQDLFWRQGGDCHWLGCFRTEELSLLLTFFQNCASLNASVLDPREKQSFFMAFPISTYSVGWGKKWDCLYSPLNGTFCWCPNCYLEHLE